jgi:signal transduction histidine kinase
VDIPLLFDENKKMSQLNQEVNNLQRQLIREKKNLQNTLEELRDTQQMLIQSEKMNALGKMVAGVAHELNNPIAFVYSNLFSIEQYVSEFANTSKQINDLIQQKADKELAAEIAEIHKETDWYELLDDISDMSRESKAGIERIKNIVADLRKFSRLDEGDIKQIDLVESIKSTVNIVRAEMVRKQIDFEMSVPQQLIVECYAGQLNQAIMNVLINAIDAVDVQGKVSLGACVENENICITITDNGSGIPDEIKNRIFEPFFTTKPVGSGVGLGLSITYKIIHDLHRGTIQLHSLPGQSTSFKITIPSKINII